MMEAGIQIIYYFINLLFYAVVHDNQGLQTANNTTTNNNMINNTEDTSNTEIKRNKQKKKIQKKDEIVRSEDNQGHQEDKNIDEILKSTGDKRSESKKNKRNKTKNKNKSQKNGDVHVTNTAHESQKANIDTTKNTAVLNKVPATIPTQSASLTVCVPPKKKQSPVKYNKYEKDKSLSFGFKIDQNILCDGGNDYSPSVSIPMPVEYNYKEVILFIKQAWQDVEKEKINGRSNILEYKRE